MKMCSSFFTVMWIIIYNSETYNIECDSVFDETIENAYGIK